MIDLHVHSTYSDGEHTPKELLSFCNEKNVNIISITDHNSIEGVKNAILNNPFENIKIIPGIEFSAKYELKDAELHILGYNMDLNDKDLNEITKNIRDENVTRMKNIIDYLKRNKNMSFSDDDIENIFSKKGNIGRPEIAKLCVKYGYCLSVHETFSKILIPIEDMLPKKKFKLSDKECIYYITKAGGIASLAHPITLKKDDDNLEAFIKQLMSYGLTSIEVYHSKHTDEFSNRLLKLTEKFNLLYSAGSDFHGQLVSPGRQLGIVNTSKKPINYATILTKIKV